MRTISHQQFFTLVGGIVLAGLGFGYGMGRQHASDGPPPVGTSLAALTVSEEPVSEEKGQRNRSAEPESRQSAVPAAGRHALLVGVTKYDHLPADRSLYGPANDVRTMRRLLQDQYGFSPDSIVSLTEDEGKPDRRPIRANIEREFRRLADLARAGDQVVILLAGHGDRQPEQNPPDPHYPEPDGIDEIFLPADIGTWKGFPDRVPRAVVDDEIGAWLDAITAKRAYVWIVFDCCHSGTMTRGTEIVRELPPDTLVPREELEKAQARAARRGGTRGAPSEKPAAFVPREESEYLVALYACRPRETTPESPQPVESTTAEYHGLLTYSVVDILTKAAESKTPLTYRDLAHRIQVRYAARPQGSPTPMVEGKGQDRIVLGVEKPNRSPLTLTRDTKGYKVNAGDLYGLIPGSILAVESPSGSNEKPKILGHVRVASSSPFDALVEPCAYEGTPAPSELPNFAPCRLVYTDYGLRRLKVAIELPDGQDALREELRKVLQPLAGDQGGIAQLVDEVRLAEWIIRLDMGQLQLLEASENRRPFALPGPHDAQLGDALRRSLEKIHRARNLISLSSRFDGGRHHAGAAVDVEIQVLSHKNESSPGEVLPQPAEGWTFRPGDLISFRIKNTSRSVPLDVTLLVVGTDFQIHPFYPRPDEVGKSLLPGESVDTPPPPGQISDEPPFGPECLVAIAVPATNPPGDFTPLTQEGLPHARAADHNRSLDSPLGQLLQSAMFQSGSQRGLGRSIAAQYGMRVLSWRTEPKSASQ